jgi:hypothetical protein
MVSLFILKSRVRGVFLFGFLSFFFLVKIQIVVGELCAMGSFWLTGCAGGVGAF